jgi:hypothetical protein
MTLENFVPERNRTYKRRFDHDKALLRLDAGESAAALAREYGVSKGMIYRIRPEAKQRSLVYHRQWRTGVCEECGGPAMRIIHGKKDHNPDGRCLCQNCRAHARRERLLFNDDGVLIAVRCGMVDCANGERWQTPDHFPRGKSFPDIRAGGFHTQCRSCQTRAKRSYRARHPEYAG